MPSKLSASLAFLFLKYYKNSFQKEEPIFVLSTYIEKITERDSNSIFSIRLSCKLFLLILSKDSIVCWSFSYCFLSFYSYSTFLCVDLLPNDRAHAKLAEIVTTFKPTLVSDNVMEVVVGAIKTTVSTDFNIEVIVW